MIPQTIQFSAAVYNPEGRLLKHKTRFQKSRHPHLTQHKCNGTPAN